MNDFEPVRKVLKRSTKTEICQAQLTRDTDQTKLVTFMHESIPRFGHSNTFSSLASSNVSEVADYKAGVSEGKDAAQLPTALINVYLTLGRLPFCFSKSFFLFACF
jgi:hypothetical protein